MLLKHIFQNKNELLVIKNKGKNILSKIKKKNRNARQIYLEKNASILKGEITCEWGCLVSKARKLQHTKVLNIKTWWVYKSFLKV
jgi:hypothetical protein